jgi:hypothetical protein
LPNLPGHAPRQPFKAGQSIPAFDDPDNEFIKTVRAVDMVA